MPQVSTQLEAARTAIRNRFDQLKGWIETEDLHQIAEQCGLTVGTLKQIKKGAKWNTKAAELLIETALLKKAYYEKMAGSPLDEESGEPISGVLSDDLPGDPAIDRPTKKKRPRVKRTAS